MCVLGGMRRLTCVRTGVAALLAAAATPGCDFFEELEDAESAGSSSGGGTEAGDDGAAGGPCVVAVDDRCEHQDLLASCDPATGVLTEVGCDALCGQNPNFTCVGTATGQHACWCVVPGKQKVYSCTELEACLGDCTDLGQCTDQCFARTDESTIRMYGALVHCAERGCDETCRDTPDQCRACTAATIADGSGCSLERAVCNEDRNDEPSWP